ncbi:MAG: hypothetical protein J6W19_01230 [Prevotella sp.]|nr:hypothetical protein [Prevotella sp.]
MNKLTLSLFALLFTMTASAASGDASALRTDSMVVYGPRLAQLTHQVDVSLRNNAAEDFEGRLWLMAVNKADDSLTPCLDTLITIKSRSSRQLILHTVLPEGKLQLRLATDADGQKSAATCDVTIQPLRKLDMKASFSLEMLSDEAVLYGSRIKGLARVVNHDGLYYGARGGKGADDGIVVWVEDSDSGERLFTKHAANMLQPYGSVETTFAYDAVFRDGARYALKAGYGMPYGLEAIDSLCFTTHTGTNTYWTAKGQVLPLPLSGEGHRVVPADAVAVDLRSLSSAEGDWPSQPIDVSQANPNCLYYLDPSGDVPQGLDESLNLVRGLQAETISLTEGHDYYCPLAFRAQLVSYLMTPSYDNPIDEARGRGYSETIVLPFRPTHINLYDVNGQTEALHANMLKVLRYYGYEADTLNVAELSSLSQMEAYKPYILGVYVGSRLLFTGENTSVPITGNAIVRGGSIDFVGTTVGLRLSPEYYVYSPADYTFRQGDADDVIAPFRACLYAADGKSHSHLDISRYVWGDKGKPGDATAIDDVQHDNLQFTDSRWGNNGVSDLQGRRIVNRQSSTVNCRLHKGIYITGGRKVVVK